MTDTELLNKLQAFADANGDDKRMAVAPIFCADGSMFVVQFVGNPNVREAIEGMNDKHLTLENKHAKT